MNQMGFGNRWRSRIRGCLHSSYASIIMNDAPTKEFNITRDDALFVGECSQSNLKNLSRFLRCFHVSSDLKVSFHKFIVFGIGASNLETMDWANILGYEAGSLSFTCLGKPIINKFNSKLSSGKSKSLSFGGRLKLIKYILCNLPTYFLSLFMTLIGVLEIKGFETHRDQ
uniref:Uncharacterized protein n=1 Tax=Lactuca sativa TaxID=4236 RepID=A0A9R1XRZ5_LACSA|nr:hypothetical protein LSAT_V11C200065840 [Lactuca sativa]